MRCKYIHGINQANNNIKIKVPSGTVVVTHLFVKNTN